MIATAMASDLTTASTPCLVLERGRLTRNALKMQKRAVDLGVQLRPHLKTVKSAAIASLAVSSGKATVSTLREAEYFAQHGLTDLTWACCAPPSKLERAARLARSGVALKLITDSIEGARAIAAQPTPLPTLIEVDSGEGRTGVCAHDEELLRIGEILGNRVAGVLTHAGHSYGCRSVEAVRVVAEQERLAAVSAAERLRSAGHTCETVSVGSTPTALHARHLDGVTEIRPGVYLFGDLFQTSIGSCSIEDIALTVLATVISRRGNRAVVDAGGLALSKDRSTARTSSDAGYGQVLDLAGRELDGSPTIDEVHQEHGIVRDAPAQMKLGAKVRILPNHACMTAAAYEEYHVVDGGRALLGRWSRCNGW